MKYNEIKNRVKEGEKVKYRTRIILPCCIIVVVVVVS